METGYPKLRAIDVRPYIQNGEVHFLLRDPLQLTEKGVIIPRPLAPLLALCDGTRDGDGLRAALAVRYGVRVGPDVMQQLLTAFDEALLLDNDRFAQAQTAALTEYRGAAFRAPGLAGQSYPAEVEELRSALASYLDEGEAPLEKPERGEDVRGLISPHIDYARGGPVYAQVWKRAEEAVRAADLVILLGTDHWGRDGAFTLTYQSYGTPFGVLPTARDVVEQLSDVLGGEAAFADEFHHQGEHSIELAAVWLHHARGGDPCEIVPILCGSFGHFVQGKADPAQDAALNGLVEALQSVMASRQTLVVAAADLAHVGPAFDGEPLDVLDRARLRAADDEIIERMVAGDAGGFFAAIQRDGDRRNVCGLPPIYVALRALDPVQGEQVAYAHCPADQNGTSVVSICGLLFR